jgi:hypothetical protein
MNKCSCIKGEYNFLIDVRGCDSLMYQDRSLWMESGVHIIPVTYEVDIKLPTSGNIKVEVATVGFTELNSALLYGTSSKLGMPDGLYCFSTDSCHKTYSRNWLNTCGLECCVDDYLTKIIGDKDRQEDIDKLYVIEKLIKSAKYSAENGMKERSISLYKEAKVSIEDLNCDCNCLKK